MYDVCGLCFCQSLSIKNLTYAFRPRLLQDNFETVVESNSCRLHDNVSVSKDVWATVYKTVRPWYRTVVRSVCLCCLSAMLVYCGQTVGWIKMKLGTEVGLRLGRTALDGDPAPPKGAQPLIFGPCLLWPNGWMDQAATWYGDRPRPRRHCVLWRSSSP